jgi:hypothetical protein
MAKFKKDDLIDAVVKMRIEKMCSTKTIIKDFLMGECGYGQAYAYEILREARKKIVEYYKVSNESAIEEAVGQLEEMAENAKNSKNYKLAFEIRKELNKIIGAYEAQKIELSGQVNIPTTIILKEIVKDKDDTIGD